MHVTQVVPDRYWFAAQDVHVDTVPEQRAHEAEHAGHEDVSADVVPVHTVKICVPLAQFDAELAHADTNALEASVSELPYLRNVRV